MTKEKIYNAIIITTLITSIFGMISYIIYDAYQVKKHKEQCVKICEPNEMSDYLSTDMCICKKNQTQIDPDKMI